MKNKLLLALAVMLAGCSQEEPVLTEQVPAIYEVTDVYMVKSNVYIEMRNVKTRNEFSISNIGCKPRIGTRRAVYEATYHYVKSSRWKTVVWGSNAFCKGDNE